MLCQANLGRNGLSERVELMHVTMIVPRRGKRPRYGASVAARTGDGEETRVDELLVREADGAFSEENLALRCQLRLE